MRFAIFPVHVSKVLRLPRKSDARSYDVLHPSRKIIFAKLKIWCSKMQPFSGNQHPGLLTSLMNMSLVLRLPREMHLCRSSSNVPHLPTLLKLLHPHVLLTFDKVQNPLRRPRKTTCVLRATTAYTFSTSQLPKVVWDRNVLRATTACTFSSSQLPEVLPEWCALYILTWKCASHHNCVNLFIISTSKSGLRPSVFYTFDFEMCFAPQLFHHLNFQKCSQNGVFCTFWLGNVLRATTVWTFSSSQPPKVVWDRQFFTLLTSKCASRHNGVQFFISHLARWLRTRRFIEPTFRPPETQIIGKTRSFATILPFRHLHLLSSDSFSSLIFFFFFSFFFFFFFSSLVLLNFLRLYYNISTYIICKISS